MVMMRFEKQQWLFLAAILCLGMVLPLATSLHKSAIVQEATFITSGYLILSHHLGVNPDFDGLILPSMISALPLVTLQPSVPANWSAWNTGRTRYEISRLFVFNNRVSPEVMIYFGRAIGMTSYFLLIVFSFVLIRWLTSVRIALLSSLILILLPSMTAFGGIFNAEIMWTVWCLVLMLSIHYQLRASRPWYVRLVTGIWLSFFLMTHILGLLFLPYLLLLVLVDGWDIYRNQYSRILTLQRLMIYEFMIPLGVAGLVLMSVSFALQSPQYYWTLFRYSLPYLFNGPSTCFLNGVIYNKIPWFYYLSVLGYKTPLICLILVLVAFATAVVQRGFNKVVFLYLVLPGIIIIGLGMTINNDFGVRLFLPLFPLMAFWVGWLLNQMWNKGKAYRVMVIIFPVYLLCQYLIVYPNDLAYLNELSGYQNSSRYLLGNNFDLGQDVKGLSRWVKANKIDTLWVYYFGPYSLEHYEIPYVQRIPGSLDEVHGYVAISANYTQGYLADKRFPIKSWLADKPCVSIIGRTIYIYQVP